VIAFVLGVALPVLARADTWQIDPVHTSVEFTVRHMTISNVKGQFQKTSGTITVNGNDPASANIDATIDASSVDTRVEGRDTHLKGPEFLDVAKYPTITFKSSKVTPAGSNKWKVTGDLTLHGVTKPVVLDVKPPGHRFRIRWATRARARLQRRLSSAVILASPGTKPSMLAA
jgi:polyisoprenoid-binding protein YceI